MNSKLRIKRSVRLDNLFEFRETVKKLKPSSQKRILEQTARVASQPIVKLAKQKVRKRSGAIRKAMNSVVKDYPQKKKTVAYIGALKGDYVVTPTGGARRRKRGEKRTKDVVVPANYSHLLENGHRIAGKKVTLKAPAFKNTTLRKGTAATVGWVKPYPFLRPAAIEGEPAAVAKIAEGFGEAIVAEHKRQKKKFNKLSA